jgi:hypothetical protein
MSTTESEGLRRRRGLRGAVLAFAYGLLALVARPSPATASTESSDHNPRSLQARVNNVRSELQIPDAMAGDPGHPPYETFQWNNWPNWPNWGNWNNWPNWNNWGNWNNY